MDSHLSATRWSEFPVGREPRPVVFLDSRVRVVRGFPDSASKLAWELGMLETRVAVPAAVMDRIRAQRVSMRGEVPSQVLPLVINQIERIEHPFVCDRGRRPLLAYRLGVSSMLGPCIVLDPEVELWWPRPGESDSEGVGGTAYLSTDGRTVRFPAHGCALTDFHRSEFCEHDTHVIGRAITSERPKPPGGVHSYGIGVWVTGRLQDPLGDRLLIAAENDAPLQVLPEAAASDGQQQSWRDISANPLFNPARSLPRHR